MTQAGVARLHEFANKLPSFETREEAENAFFRHRDELLTRLAVAAEQSQQVLDYSPESLNALESWYARLWGDDAFDSLGIDRGTFERCIAMYFGEVVVRSNSSFSWAVSENPILRRRWAFGIGTAQEFVFLWRLKDFYERSDQEGGRRLWRAWKRHAQGTADPADKRETSVADADASHRGPGRNQE